MFDFVVVVISTLVGGYSIWSAIDHFKKERYFFFGMYIMSAVYFAASIATIAHKLLI